MHGKGKLYLGDEVFQGNFKMGKCCGFGTLYSLNGLKEYEGNWKNGRKNGTGKEYIGN